MPPYKPDAIYVDNCCNAGVRAALQRIWPGIPVKLDLYHWFDRWDKAIGMPQHDVRRCVFRAELRGACFVPDRGEYRRIKARLSAGETRATHRQIISECRRVVPRPAELHANVKAVVDKWVMRDRAIWASSGPTAPTPPHNTSPKEAALLQRQLRRRFAAAVLPHRWRLSLRPRG